MLTGDDIDPATTVVGVEGLTAILDALTFAGYDVWVPAIRDGVVVTRRRAPDDDLPTGFVTEQAPGGYRLVATEDHSRFSWAVGPQTWKPILHPASVATMKMAQPDPEGAVAVSVATQPARPVALFGMRPCDIAAVDKLDRVLLDAPATAEPTYAARRRDAFFVVINCGVPAATCCCASVDTGPFVDGRTTTHDIEITELVDAAPGAEPEYVVEAISDRGAGILGRVQDAFQTRAPASTTFERVSSLRRSAEQAFERSLPASELRSALDAAHDDSGWAQVAETCLACGNCTSVCPTCFCTTTTDIGDLSGRHVTRQREWESCFSLEFSRLGDAPVRSSLAARYRQWMTHKLGTWHDQFGESGCVGCGRCTTWCPAGIDFVEVARAVVARHEAPDPRDPATGRGGPA